MSTIEAGTRVRLLDNAYHTNRRGSLPPVFAPGELATVTFYGDDTYVVVRLDSGYADRSVFGASDEWPLVAGEFEVIA